MIIDALSMIDRYKELLPNIHDGIEKMESVKDWKPGEKYIFESGYVFFQEGTTKPLEEAQFEAHRNYVDVQVVLKGNEYLAWSELTDLTEIIPYNTEKDVQKFVGENAHMMKISEGMVYICFPWDAHKAVFHMDQPLQFTKGVIKLKINKK
ncbi:YhcH/YjgK/YiaL family protein [Caldifermentibacillus hisashii]|uniref:YhcH/YjgK/YiaL family protein n=1 Tax=Caldifermentibacillus hisashii TaxID=996558 RepID=UPI0033670622